MNKTKRILFSAGIVALAVASFVAGTSAYFSDTETSTGNVLAAGAIDLKIDNTSYYNGEESTSTTWGPTDLVDELFFDFQDLKPGDWGEDTVSIRVDSNASWACVDIDLTANSDETCNEPESEEDLNCVEEEDGWNGDLADELYFAFWADDGDNVWEEDETILKEGWASEILNGVTWPLADSQHPVLEEGPLVGGQTYYIGKAWCFGQMHMEQLSPREEVRSPLTAKNVVCDGSVASNASQTDKVMGDISFRAIQSRHNEDYLCERPESLLWIIGDEEGSQTENTVDELNWVAMGDLPNPATYAVPFTRVITTPVDNVADKDFPWNSNYNKNYARTVNVDFSYSGPDIPVRLTLSWSPGRSADEQKEVYLDSVSLGTTPVRHGTPVAGWWEEMERYAETFDFTLTSGNHTIKFEHLYGDGTLWDYVKLERL